jgi:threonine/homoserine efflux transporter RhtA
VYCASVFTSNRGSACAENVAFGVQYALQTSHPLPVSHASKKASAVSVIDVVIGVTIISSFLNRLARQRFARREHITIFSESFAEIVVHSENGI